MAARNADQGGQRKKLRDEAKAISAVLRASRAMLEDVHGVSK